MDSFMAVFLLFVALAVWMFLNISPLAGLALGSFAVFGLFAVSASN